jgi:hypothetical protein
MIARSLVAVLFILAPTLCHAGPAAKRMMAVMGQVVYVPFTINGNSSISSAGTTDTGTESIATGAGYVSAVMECDAGDGDSAVLLYVDGVEVAAYGCDFDFPSNSGTLTSPLLTAGNHNIRVEGVANGTGTFTADTFMKPRP